MTSREFCYWFQGFLEIRKSGPTPPQGLGLTADQVEMVEKHLSLVFLHEIDNSYGDKEHTAKLNAAHMINSASKPRC